MFSEVEALHKAWMEKGRMSISKKWNRKEDIDGDWGEEGW